VGRVGAPEPSLLKSRTLLLPVSAQGRRPSVCALCPDLLPQSDRIRAALLTLFDLITSNRPYLQIQSPAEVRGQGASV
jgi:hypothetical protein